MAELKNSLRAVVGLLALAGYNLISVQSAWAAFALLSGPFTGVNTQTGRIFRDGNPPTSCADDPKVYPGIFSAGSTFNYESAAYTNTGPDRCVEFYFVTGTCGTNAHMSIYDGSYDPNNQSANFLGDIGSSVDSTMSIDMTAGQTVVVVVTNTSAPDMCNFNVEVQYEQVSAPPPPPATGPVVDVVAVTQETIRNYMNRRADLITSAGPSTTHFHDRFGGSLFDDDSDEGDEPMAFAMEQAPTVDQQATDDRQAAAGASPVRRQEEETIDQAAGDLANRRIAGAMSFSGGVRGSSGTVYYSTSLHRMMTAFGPDLDKEGRASMAAAMPRFNVWSEGRVTFYDDNRGGGAQKGTSGVIFLGADYLVHPAVIVGGLVQLDLMDERSTVLNNSTSGTGWMAGPYVSAKVLPYLFFDARATWGTSNNRVSPFNTYTDSFQTTRGLYSAKLTGMWRVENWRFKPNVEVLYFHEKQHGYTDSLGNVIPSQNIHLGRTIFGPEVEYTIATGEESKVVLNGGLKGIWDFSKDGSMTVAGIPVTTNKFRGRVEGGATFDMTQNASASLAVFYDGIGATLNAWGLNARFGFAF